MRVILCSKNFAANKNISHIGLGVAALNTCKTLIAEGIACEAWQIISADDLQTRINLDITKNPVKPITHVVISAPWIPTIQLNSLCHSFPGIHFTVNTHSNVGFLQADPSGMKFIREDLDLEMAVPNFSVAANSEKMKEWIIDAYGNACAYLPNLYYLHDLINPHRPLWSPGAILRIGCFGAIRPQKNLVSATAAAMELGHQLKAHTEIWISSGRAEGGGLTVLNTVREMVRGLPTTTLHESGWQSWPSFRRLVGSMHLLFQPSYTESFNMVTADGITEGVPSVVGEAIDWVPDHWRGNVDDVFSLARVGKSLLFDHSAASHGLKYLKNYVHNGKDSWKRFLHLTLKP